MLRPLSLLAAAVVLAAPLAASAEAPVFAFDDDSGAGASAFCVATGVGPGLVAVAGAGASTAVWTIVNCSVYDDGNYIGAVSRKSQEPVVTASGAFAVSSANVTLVASVT